MKSPLFRGCATAIITPFTSDSVDIDAFRKLIDWQIDSGINAIVVCGTTGEASTMSYAERMRVIDTAVRQADGRIPIIAGTGSNSTETAITLSKDAAQAGADGLLLVTPYYNKATQDGLIRHYAYIADHVSKPIILYNVPSRTGVCCTAETYRTLSSHPNIIGVKEASGNQNLVQKTIDLCPGDFYVWSGNDDETAATMLLGGIGVISVVSNVVPSMMVALTNACLAGNFSEAGRLQVKLRKLADVLFREVNPIPVKTALSIMGLCEEAFRLPLCRLNEAHRAELTETLEAYGLL